MSRGDRFIFVGGAHRSGTTLVQNMLDSHPAIFGGPEFLRLPEIIRLRHSLRKSIDEGLIDVFCTYKDVDDAIAALIERLLLPIADQHQSMFLSEKSPHNVHVFPELLSVFPSAKAINVVRDPRAVVASLLRVRQRAKDLGDRPPNRAASLRRSIATTEMAMRSGLEASHVQPERTMTIVYEELVLNPEAVTRKICEFLEIDWYPAMTRPSELSHLGETPITRTGVWYDVESFSRDPEPTEIDKWRTDLSGLQVAVIERAFDSLVREFGYKWESNRASLLNKVASIMIIKGHGATHVASGSRVIKGFKRFIRF